MSNFLAIATVTTALRQLVQDAAVLAVPGATVTTVRPAASGAGLPATGVNLYLYQATPNAALRNAALPERRTDGSLVRRPQVALDLHYLLSFYGSESDLEPQRLLGSVTSALHARPVLPRETIRSMIEALVIAEPGHYLADADLAEQVEVVRFSQLPLNLDDQSKLWNAFFQAPYALSAAYLGSVVLIEHEVTPQTALPVQQRNIYAVSFREPVIEQVVAAAGAATPVTAGSVIRITGRALAGDVTRVRLGDAEIAPAIVTDRAIELALTEPPFPTGSLRAGVLGVQVQHLTSIGTPPAARPAAASNVAALVLRPRITAVNVTNVTGTGNAPRAADIGLTVAPGVGQTQRVVLLLNEQTTTSPQAYTVAAPRRTADATAITVPVQGVRAGTYFVRLQVDGAESPLDLDPVSPGFGAGDHSVMTAERGQWREANQRYLMAALEGVRRALHHHVAALAGAAGGDSAEERIERAVQHELEEAARALPAPAALESLCRMFGLSSFERDILLLCAGVELDGTFAVEDGNGQHGAERLTPTFGLALAALPDGHWSAVSPTAPLRHWRLIEVGHGETLLTSPLRIDERVLHYLTGIPAFDERLRGLLVPVTVHGSLPPSHHAVSQQIAGLWSRRDAGAVMPVVHLAGPDPGALQEIAAAASFALGWHLYRLRAADVPAAPGDRDTLAAVWQREAALRGGALLLDGDGLDGPGSERALPPFLDALSGPVVVTGPGPVSVPMRPVVRLDAGRLGVAEQRALWHEALGPLAPGLDAHLDTVSVQFPLGMGGIRAAGAQVQASAPTTGDLPTLLWDACRVQARPRLDDLARRIEPVARWDDLVLPEAQRQTLRDILACARQRPTVHERWGFGARSSRGLGNSALFSGSSGTGKTMAAEVIARELRLDLYHIDLSAVVSKYIGETEKNLRRVFDAAEEGGAVLLFDEADALFGKRSEVKDSHDRYANIEVSYLLQRMEAYGGLAILTTNMKQALDPAFLRRLRFLVQFPFPDAAQRAAIWRRAFPPETPTEGLDPVRLAQLNVAGGNIRNIALTAAFLAADAGEPVRMRHVLRAARAEYAKLERPLTEAETSGWDSGMDVEVHIEAMVLHGLPAAARRRIADAVAGELERLVREQGLPAWMTGGEDVFSVDGGAFTVEAGARAERIGAQIAQAIYGGQGQ